MTPKEYMALFETLVAWGHDDQTAMQIIHYYIGELLKKSQGCGYGEEED